MNEQSKSETNQPTPGYGEVAYQAYIEAVGGVAFNGDKLPDFKTMKSDPAKQKQVAAWEAAARAVASRCYHDLRQSGAAF